MVDLNYLPDIFSLLVFIVGFRPLMRKVGAQVNLWFLGWGFALLHNVAMFVAQPHGWAHQTTAFVAYWSVDLCALSFVFAAASIKGRQFAGRFVATLALPVLLQSGLFLLNISRPILLDAVQALFLLPLFYTLLMPAPRSRPLTVISAAIVIFAAMVAPLGAASAPMIGHGILCLLFLSSAYLYLVSNQRKTRGSVAAVIGLTGWGLSYLVVAVIVHQRPGVALNRTLVELPQYLVIVGIIMTLIEEYVTRTERLAMHDPLTDLPNRRLFEERLIATMEEARVHRTTVACLVIDVDNFKQINDTLGHSAGDQLLRALAVRLSWHMSPRDILARTGGDEFTALLAGVTDEHHLRFIAGAMMSAASVPISVDGKAVDVKISVGIALSPDDAEDIDGLRRAADEAMYSAKRRGGSLLAFANEI